VFRRLLIANRGEVAIRIARTARAMGIRCVGVFSEADRSSLHLAAMDEAYELGPASPAESYLHIDRVLDAARRGEAEAVHPGYGFLAENAEFASRCEEEGFAFVGPPPRSMRVSGDKIAARRAMATAGIPVTSGVDRTVRSPEEAADAADRLGYPILFKATAGGGGIGMSRVDDPSRLRQAFESARSVAMANFGSPDLFVEAYIERARHIEIQVLLGPRGRGLHLGERECSVQRRHQKLVEETPSRGLTSRLRQRLGEAAVKGLTSIGYRNAGTVEFLVCEGRFTFNEVNARLQVEHPVTEMVTGIDLVRQQLLIAAGEEPDLSRSEVSSRGHALECRINAEDPLSNFLPSPGRIVGYREPAGADVRVDSGVGLGSTVPAEYDPLLAKVVVRGRTRGDSIRRMRGALSRFEIRGVRSTIPFHAALLGEPRFVRGDLWTTMVADLRIAERLKGRGPSEERVAAIAAALAADSRIEGMAGRRRLTHTRPSAWSLSGRPRRPGGAHAIRTRRGS
jgi:pyruvate carboxylase subunit A